MTPRHFSDDCLVLKRSSYGEADRILTLFSRHHGKFTAIAKGVRKLTSRKAPHIELFVETKLFFALGKNLPLITEAQTILGFEALKSNLPTTRLAFHLLEVIDRLLPENQPHPEVFTKLVEVLSFLNGTNQLATLRQEQAVSQFELKLLQQLGFGFPKNQHLKDIDYYIETILDRHLVAKANLS